MRPTRCLLDLDGVVADFHTAWYKVHTEVTRPDPWPAGVWSLSEIHNMTWDQSCTLLDYEFWETIPWMPDGKRILEMLEDHFGPDNICILTSNHVKEADIAAYGKVRWIERQLPRYNHRYFLGAAKHFLAHRGVVLIDDKNENIDQFITEGGEGFLLPRPWNRKHNIAELAIYQLGIYLADLRAAK